MQRKINVLLLLFALIGGAIGFAIGEALLSTLSPEWPRMVVIGLYFGILALCIGLACLIAEMISPKLSGTSWRQRYTGLSWKLLVPATLVMLFAAGSLLQLVYGLQFNGFKQVKDIVLVIDNSESMLETDPNSDRFDAAKQLINKMDSDKRAAIVVFNDTAELAQPFVNVSNQGVKDSVHKVIDGIEPAIGGTDFAVALDEALQTIQGATDSERGTMVILLSDGFSESSIESLLATYKEQKISINTVGLSLVMSKGSELLKEIASATGGSYQDVTKSNGLALAFKNIYDTIDNRTLLTERTGAVADNVFYKMLRILSLAILGVLIGVSLGIVFDNRYLALSFGIGGFIGGLLAGFILESGLSGNSFGDGLSRLAAALVLALIIGLFPLIVPIRENNSSRPYRGGRNRDVSGGASTGLSGRPKNNRSHGF